MEVFIKNQFEGFHKWVNAPEEVAYLRDLHRHIFKIKTTIQVEFADRDVEFIMAQHRIGEIIKSWDTVDKTERDLWSCETMAIKILEKLHELYPGREMSCEVSEDGENGAVVYMTADGKIC